MVPAYADEDEIVESPPVAPDVIEETTALVDVAAVEDIIWLLRRDTNFVLSFPPRGPAEVRTYRGGGAREQEGTADVQEGDESPSAEEREQAALRATALGNRDPEERSAALHALAGTEIGLQTALEVLASDREPEVLKNALDALTGYVTLPLDPVLTAMRNEDPSVRIQALELLSLHRANDPRVDEVLTRAATTDADEDVRESARALIDAR